MTPITTVNNTIIPATTTSSQVAVTSTAVKNPTTPAPNITTSNSSTVKVSAAALIVAKAVTATPAPMTVVAVLASGANIPAGTVIKDTAANISTNLKALGALATFANVASITLSDTKAGAITIARADIQGDLSSTSNTDPNLAVIKKITSSYTLNVTGLAVADALTLKSPAKTATLSLSISDTADNIAASLTALQTAAKAKSIAGVAIQPTTAGATKPNFTITADQFKASPELLAIIKGDYDLTITGVLAADAVTAAGNADKVLKSSGSGSTQSKVAISDTSANLVTSIAALETAATAGRLTSITVSDHKALVLTEAQIKADKDVLAVKFTSKTNVEATNVAASDVLSVQNIVNANIKVNTTVNGIAGEPVPNVQAINIPSDLSGSDTMTFNIPGMNLTNPISVTGAQSVVELSVALQNKINSLGASRKPTVSYDTDRNRIIVTFADSGNKPFIEACLVRSNQPPVLLTVNNINMGIKPGSGLSEVQTLQTAIPISLGDTFNITMKLSPNDTIEQNFEVKVTYISHANDFINPRFTFEVQLPVTY